jgi:hypothetical protein
VPAHTSAGGEFLDLGPQDQARHLAQQFLPLGQRQTELLRRQPDNPRFELANLDRLHLSLPAFGLEFEHPFHDRPPMSPKGAIVSVQRQSDQVFSAPGLDTPESQGD